MVRKQIATIITSFLLVFSLFFATQVDSLHAQTLSELSDADRKSVADALESAQQYFESKDFGNAIASLERAYGLFPEPNILYRIGVAYEQLSEFKVANLYFRRYLALRPDAKDAPSVRAHIKKNEGKIATADSIEKVRFDIDIVTNPPGAEVIFDGVPKGKTPLKISALRGRHLIEITKKDYVQSSTFVNLSTKNERINLQLKPYVEPYSAPVWPWVAIGVGGASMAFSSVAFTISESAKAEVEAIDKNTAQDRPTDRDATYTKGVIYERVGYGTFIGGAIVFGIGAYSLLLSPNPRSAFRLTGDGFAVKF